MRSLQFVKFTAIAVALLTTMDAGAVSLRAKFKEFSSGPDIYVCNAGVASQQSNQICYFHGKAAAGNECTKTSCSTAKEICNTDCRCPTDYGRTYINSMGLTVEPYTDTDEARGKVSSSPDLISQGPKFSEFNSNQVTVWNNRLTNIYTKFTSEVYNAAVLLDVCYRGTQLPNYNGEVAITTGVSAVPFLTTNLNSSYPTDNDRTGLLIGQGHYLENSAETVQTFSICGDTPADTQFVVDANGVPTGGPNFVSTAPALIQQSETVNRMGNSIYGKHFCKVRYVFRETNFASLIPLPRPNRSEGAEICTLTDITDPPAAKRPLN